MMNELKVLKDGIEIPSSLIKKIECLANIVRSSLDAELADNGIPPFESNITYLTHYCYIGVQSVARLNYGDFDSSSPKLIQARALHLQLVSYAQVVWELGGQLTFDEHGKHTVFFMGGHF